MRKAHAGAVPAAGSAKPFRSGTGAASTRLRMGITTLSNEYLT